ICNLLKLLLKHLSRKRFDNIVVYTRLYCGYYLVLFSLGSNHQKRNGLEGFVRSHMLKQINAFHDGHIPVRYDQAITTTPKLAEGLRTVFGFIDVFEAELLKKVLYNPSHGREVIYNEHLNF